MDFADASIEVLIKIPFLREVLIGVFALLFCYCFTLTLCWLGLFFGAYPCVRQ